jgi:hypothetical protein
MKPTALLDQSKNAPNPFELVHKKYRNKSV